MNNARRNDTRAAALYGNALALLDLPAAKKRARLATSEVGHAKKQLHALERSIGAAAIQEDTEQHLTK